MTENVNAELEALDPEAKTWLDQFKDAIFVNGGDWENATAMQYVGHIFAFPWKILFACLPPVWILGGWLCFFCSLVVIGLMTALVGDAAAIFGCLVGLKDSVTAIT